MQAQQDLGLDRLLNIIESLDHIPITAAAKSFQGYRIPDSERRERGHQSIDADLLSHAQNLMNFLHEVDEAKSTLEPYSVEGMRLCAYRYEVFWVPLLKKAYRKRKILSAPLDIAWAWFMHTLAPSKYAADLKRLINLDAAKIDIKGPLYRGNLDEAREIWEAEYPESSFDPPGRPAAHDSEGVKRMRLACQEHFELGKSKIVYDLVAAAQRQQVFFYQVALPHWRCKWFLQRGVDRYRRFLQLRRDNPGIFMVPTFDIDLVWHAHMASHKDYVEQCSLLTGRPMFDHDDSVNNREAGGRLETSYVTTAKTWSETFGELYAFPGGMWRGPFPHQLVEDILSKDSMQEQMSGELLVSEDKSLEPATDMGFRCGPVVEIPNQSKGCKILEMFLSSDAANLGKVIFRAPTDHTGRPACILTFDSQGACRAMARLIPPGYLPDLQMGCDHIPSQRPGTFDPAFMIECCRKGSSSDWGILQAKLNSKGKFKPTLYRCGKMFWSEEAIAPQYCGQYCIVQSKHGTRASSISAQNQPHKRPSLKRLTSCFGSLPVSEARQSTPFSFELVRKGDQIDVYSKTQDDVYCLATLFACLSLSCDALTNQAFV